VTANNYDSLTELHTPKGTVKKRGGKVRPARRADNLAAIYLPFVEVMREP
jgi:hypothetical protein